MNNEGRNEHLNLRQAEAVHKVERFFTDPKQPYTTSFIRSCHLYRVISCRRFNSIFYFIKDYLKDYNSYLDYLYVNKVEEALEDEIYGDDLEMIIKAIVCYYNTDVDYDGKSIMRIINKDTGSLLYYNKSDTSPTFDVDFLDRIKLDITSIFEEAKNKPNIEEIIKFLNDNPRPSFSLRKVSGQVCNKKKY